MTVSTAYTVLQYAGNGATTAFAVTWPFLTGSLVVTLVASTGVETTQTLGTHYTVSGGTDSNGLPAVGTVTMITAPASGQTLRIARATPKTQASTWGENDAFPQKVIEAALDKLTLAVQEGASPGTVNDGIGGDVMELVTSGATDYWDAESQIIRNVADAVEATDAVNYGQLQGFALEAGTGNVIKPASSTDNAVARFDGSSGAILQNSAVTISDLGVVSGATVVRSGEGTAGVPAFSQTNDTDTGVFFSAANTFNVATAGVGRWEVSPNGTFGFNYAAEAVSASTMRIDQPTGDTGSDTRVTISNTAGNRAALTQTNATDHITMAMGAASVGVLGNRWGLGLSGSGTYSIVVEHGGFPSTYHANFGVHVGATSARHPLTVGESEAPGTTGQMVGIYKAGPSLASLRNTTDNIEAVVGALAGSVVFGSVTAHELQFYVSGSSLLRFSGSILRPENDGAVALGSTTHRFGGLHLSATSAINWDNGNITLTHSTGNLAVGGGNLLVGYTTSNGSFLLQVNSQIFATNATISTSDGRFKTNVAPIEDATEIVKALRPVAYDWKPHEVHQFAKERQAGFIAQEVREAVAGTDWGASLIQENEQAGEPFLGLAETKLLPVVVKALQEALTRIETLEARLAEVVR